MECMMENGVKPMNKMRRFFNFMLLVATVAMAASCVEENGAGLEQESQVVVPMTFIGHIDEGQTPEETDVESKTSLGEAVGPEGQKRYPVRWSTTDHITVFNDNGPGVHFTDVTVHENGSQATFKGSIAMADVYHAVYPKHDDATYSVENQQITTVLPTVQPATHNTFADGVNLAIAQSEGENLYFKNVGALLTVTCPSNYARSIKVISRDPSVKMSGKGVITYNNGEPVVVPSEEAVNYVEVTCAQTKLNDVYYFVVYPGNYSKGFDILITSYDPTNESCCLLSSTKALDLRRNVRKVLFNPGDSFKFGWNSPAQPSSVQAALSGADVNVTWAWSGDKTLISGYKVYARIAGITEDGELKNTITGSDTKQCIVTGLEPGQTYEFGVQATAGGTAKKDTYIIWSNEVTIPELENCAAPTNLFLEHLNPAVGDNSYPNPNRVVITWTDNSGIEAGYMFHKYESDKYNTADIAANGTSWETAVEVGQTYTFGVQAIGSAGNNSEITKMENYTPMTWLELLDYQAVDGECIKPVFASITQDSENQATISWTCGSGAAVGYNIYCREASQPQWTGVYKYQAKTGAAGTKESCIILGLEIGKTYIFGIQAVGSTMERNSNVVTTDFAMVSTEDRYYDWETARGRIPEFPNMTLCYGGNPERTPYLWDKERWEKHVVYEDVNNPGQYFWLFDSFLALETKSGNYLYSISSDGSPSATKEHWFQQLNYWFDEVNGFQALDDCIEENIAKAGPYPHKRYVVFSLPDPIYFQNYGNQSGGTTYWGSIYGNTMDFSTEDHRIMAYKWMINQVRARFAAKNYRHIELAGFYIISETFSKTYNSNYKKFDEVIPPVAEYLKTYHEGLYWIPYAYGESGHNETFVQWSSIYKLTAAILQPNYYWDTSKSLTTTCNYINNNNMGMEFEFEGSHGEPGYSKNKNPRTSSSILERVMTDEDAEGTPKGQLNPQRVTNKQRFRDYMTYCKNTGIYYNNRMLVLYSGTNGWVELASSNEQLDKNLYDETAKFFLRHPYKQNLYNTTTPNFGYGGSLN